MHELANIDWDSTLNNLVGFATCSESKEQLKRITPLLDRQEAEMSFAVLAMSTDVDSWSDAPHVTVEQVVQTAMANVANAQRVVALAIPKIASYDGELPDAQKSLGGGGAIMTRRDLISTETLARLWPILAKHFPDRKEEVEKKK